MSQKRYKRYAVFVEYPDGGRRASKLLPYRYVSRYISELKEGDVMTIRRYDLGVSR